MIEISLPPKPIYDELYGIDKKYRMEVNSIKTELALNDGFYRSHKNKISYDTYYKTLQRYELIEKVKDKLEKCNRYCKVHLDRLIYKRHPILITLSLCPFFIIINHVLGFIGAASIILFLLPLELYFVFVVTLALVLLCSRFTLLITNKELRNEVLENKFLSYIGPKKEAIFEVLRKRENKRYALKMKEYNTEIDSLEEKFPGIKKAGGDIAVYNRDVFNENVAGFIESLEKIINECNFRYTNQWWKLMNPERFEKEVANWFVNKGFEADTTQYIGDGGVDIVLRKNGQREFVQCKHYLDQKVQVATVRELLGVMTSENVKKGYVVSLYGMTQGAYEFATRNNIVNITLNELSLNVLGNKYSINTKRQFEEVPFYTPGIVRVHVGDCYIHGDIFDNIFSARLGLDKNYNYTDRWYFIISPLRNTNSKTYYTIASCPFNMKQDIQKTKLVIV